jgi:ubiquinone/menaquinone biosynthesis C-methylase UbiE
VAIAAVDYDRTSIATTYDSARTYSDDVLQQCIDVIAAHLPSQPQLIVDVGCGTGRYSQALADRFEANVIGIDPSERMLAVAGQAWRRPRRVSPRLC